MFNKTPSAVRGDSGLLSISRFGRIYCKHCNSEELHEHGRCIQCKQEGIRTTKIAMHFNGKRRS